MVLRKIPSVEFSAYPYTAGHFELIEVPLAGQPALVSLDRHQDTETREQSH